MPQPSEEGFTILKSLKRSKIGAVKRVLPDWLKNPEIVNPNLNSGPILEELELILNSDIISKLKTDNISRLFPVQKELLLWLLKCDELYKQGWWVRDTCVSMPTGSGLYIVVFFCTYNHIFINYF